MKRRYLIYYWTENSDVASDLEVIVEADNIEDAIKEFKKQIRVFKRIQTITELPYGE